MAEIPYYFNSWNIAGTNWDEPDKAVDNNLGTFAYTASNGNIIYLDGNTCLGTDLGIITKVELHAYGYGDGDDRIDLTPYFFGGLYGDEHQVAMPAVPGWGSYVDITSDPNAPTPWTWSQVRDLQCIVEYDKVKSGATMYCSKVEVRVTYTEPWVPPVSDIDVGANPIDRPFVLSLLWTYVDKNNPANAGGALHSIDIYTAEPVTGLRVGTFYVVSGNTLKCRDSELVGDIGIGLQTFSDLSIAVQEGDYIGCYATLSGIAQDAEGYDGVWGLSGEFIDPNDEAEYAFNAGRAFSLYGYGDIEAPTYYHGLKVQGVGELALCDAGSHPLRIRKGGVTYGLELVATDDPNASTVRVKTGTGIKAIRKYS